MLRRQTFTKSIHFAICPLLEKALLLVFPCWLLKTDTQKPNRSPATLEHTHHTGTTGQLTCPSPRPVTTVESAHGTVELLAHSEGQRGRESAHMGKSPTPRKGKRTCPGLCVSVCTNVRMGTCPCTQALGHSAAPNWTAALMDPKDLAAMLWSLEQGFDHVIQRECIQSERGRGPHEWGI